MKLIRDGIHLQFPATRGHSIERIGLQVDENLLKLVRVAVNHQRPGAEIRDHLDAGARAASDLIN